MKNNRNTWQLVGCLMAAMLAFSSCGEKQDRYSYDYLPVQMSKGDSWSIIDKDGKEVVKEEYPADASLSEICDGVYWVKQGDKYQLYSLKNPKKPVMDEEFTQATLFRAGVAAVSNPNEQIRLIGTDGKTIATLDNSITRCYAFQECGYAVIENAEDKQGVISNEGQVLVNPIYYQISISDDGTLVIKEDSESKELTIMDIRNKALNDMKMGRVDLEKFTPLLNNFQEDKMVIKNSDDEDAYSIVIDKTGKRLFDIRKARWSTWEGYMNGYMTFGNEDFKYGVADDKGEIVIRPKYENIHNFGNGHFAVEKGEKWGVVNAKDETVIDFDYDYWYIRMGQNYVMKDGSSFSLIGPDGKEITSFDVCNLSSDGCVDYVDVEGLAYGMASAIEEYEKAPTAKQMAKSLSLDIDNYHYTRCVDFLSSSSNGKLKAELRAWYDEYMAEEKTHQEKVSDGWFTYNQTVSDGWQWTNVRPSSIKGTIKLTDSSVKLKDLYKALTERVAEGRTKISDGKYSKNVKLDGKTVECQIQMTLNNDDIDLDITFRK